MRSKGFIGPGFNCLSAKYALRLLPNPDVWSFVSILKTGTQLYTEIAPHNPGRGKER